MIVQQLDKHIQENRNLIQKILTLKILKILAPHAQDFIMSLLSRDIVNPFVENRIAGYITLTRNLYTISVSPKVVRIIVSERINDRLLGKVLELLSSYDCLRAALSVACNMYTTLQNISVVEVILMNSDTSTLSRIENMLDELRLIDFVDYSFVVDGSNLTINLVFFAKPIKSALKTYAGRLEVSVHWLTKDILEITIRVNKALDKLRRLSEVLATKTEVREGLLSYYLM